jgi:hypothetical protein
VSAVAEGLGACCTGAGEEPGSWCGWVAGHRVDVAGQLESGRHPGRYNSSRVERSFGAMWAAGNLVGEGQVAGLAVGWLEQWGIHMVEPSTLGRRPLPAGRIVG